MITLWKQYKPNWLQQTSASAFGRLIGLKSKFKISACNRIICKLLLNLERPDCRAGLAECNYERH